MVEPLKNLPNVKDITSQISTLAQLVADMELPTTEHIVSKYAGGEVSLTHGSPDVSLMKLLNE